MTRMSSGPLKRCTGWPPCPPRHLVWGSLAAPQVIRLLEHAFNAAAMAEDLVKIQRAIVATLTVAALLIAVVPAGAASASTPDLMVQRSPRIWSIDASTAQTLINKDGTRTGW